MLLNIKLHN